MANLYEQFHLESKPGGGVEIIHTCVKHITCVGNVAEALAYIEAHECDAPPPPPRAFDDSLIKHVYDNWMADFARPLLVRFPRNDCE